MELERIFNVISSKSLFKKARNIAQRSEVKPQVTKLVETNLEPPSFLNI